MFDSGMSGGGFGGQRRYVTAGGTFKEQAPFSVYCAEVVRTRIDFEDMLAAEFAREVDAREVNAGDLGALMAGNADITTADITFSTPPVPE